MVKTFYKNINWIFFSHSFKTHRKKCLNVLSWISHRRQVHQVSMKDLLNPVRKMCNHFTIKSHKKHKGYLLQALVCLSSSLVILNRRYVLTVFIQEL